MRPILLTGGTGFIGSAVVRALIAGSDGANLRVLSRRPLPAWMTEAGVRWAPGDLTSPDALRSCSDGVDTVLHMASQIGGDPAVCAAVNHAGTGALLTQARRAGVPRVVYLSTCAVYGPGVHRGAAEADLVTAPVSATSRTRLAAEAMVLEHGGIVLRPHLVYGDGDVHVVSALAAWLRKVPAWADNGSARMSLVAVRDLAAVLAALSRRRWGSMAGTVFHVNHPEIVRARRLLTMVGRLLNIAVPRMSLPVGEHRQRTGAALPALTDHQYSLLTEDHWYASERIWRFTGVPCGPGLGQRLVESASWYRGLLGAGRVLGTP